MENKRNSQNIYFKDLLFSALRCWRAMLAVALVGALLLGGLQLVPGLTGSNDSLKEEYLAEKKQYEVAYNSLVTKIAVLQENLDTQRQYMEKSVFMRLNPYAFYETNVKLYVDTNYQVDPNLSLQDPDKSESVLAAYEAAFLSGDFIDTLATLAGTEPQYATELVTCLITPTANTISISISCVNQEIANACLDAVIVQVSKLRESISAAVASHDVGFLSKSVSQKVDQTIVTKQAEITNRTTSFQKVLDDAEVQLSSLVRPTNTGTVWFFVIYVLLFTLLGALLGAFLVVGFVWIRHISSSKVYSAQTLRDRTGLKVLGCIRSKAITSRADQWVLRKEGRSINDPEKQAVLLAAGIRNRCKDVSSILITGRPTAEARDHLIPALQAAMADKTILDAKSLCLDADAQGALASCDAVILVAQCGVSYYGDILAEAETVNECGKKLLGCVLLDG